MPIVLPPAFRSGVQPVFALAFDAVASLSALQQGIEIGMAATLMQSSSARSETRANKQDAVMPFISKTPKPPYYAVVFTSINADVDHTEHRESYKRMV